MITKELESILNCAVMIAITERHEYLTLEHLFLALLTDNTTANILRHCGADLQILEKELEEFISQNSKSTSDQPQIPEQTNAFQRVVDYAISQAQNSGQKEIKGANILVALYEENKSHAVYLLNKQEISRLDILNNIAHGISKVDIPKSKKEKRDSFVIFDEDEKELKNNPLTTFTVNLISKAAAGHIDPLIGRTAELERTVQVLCRRRKNNPIYVGDPGVGKTAIAEGLALKIYNKEVPEVLHSAQVYLLDMGAVIAGAKYRGEFEQRIKSVIQALKELPGSILVIDEIHTIVGANSVGNGSLDASNLLKPVLASGEIRCIGSTTYSEYKTALERDRGLGRRFQKIEISEPTIEETIQILVGLKDYYEKYHGVSYTQESLKAAAELSAKYINDRFLPDKAIDVIDEVGASLRLLSSTDQHRSVVAHDVELVVARMAKIPPKSVSSSDRDSLRILEQELKSVIFGQDKAIDQLVKVIKLSRSGLGHPHKPIGSFLFSGPTGVGKTELTKQLAQKLGVQFLRFDMSEYMEKHTVSRLIGAPPGYVGFDQGGLLTDAISKTPYTVLVLDEIEKAHPDLFNILLQVMDHATLTDNNGKKADFRNVILIMTTNAGAREIGSESIGFQENTTINKSKEAIERMFSPEFRNRLDALVMFEQLDFENMMKVVEKFIQELRDQLIEKNVTIELTGKGQTWLTTKGFDKIYGARAMGRLIQSKIKEPLADEILFGKLENGGKVVIDERNGELILDILEIDHEIENISKI